MLPAARPTDSREPRPTRPDPQRPLRPSPTQNSARASVAAAPAHLAALLALPGWRPRRSNVTTHPACERARGGDVPRAD